jgi:hypothetical protein
MLYDKFNYFAYVRFALGQVSINKNMNSEKGLWVGDPLWVCAKEVYVHVY